MDMVVLAHIKEQSRLSPGSYALPGRRACIRRKRPTANDRGAEKKSASMPGTSASVA